MIRTETSNDYEAIREINIAAFAHHPYSHQTEHLIVEALRAAGWRIGPCVSGLRGMGKGLTAVDRC